MVKLNKYVDDVIGDISNMSVEQYMLWVHNQANKLPSVARIEDPSVFKVMPFPQSESKIIHSPNVDNGLYASNLWKAEMVNEFNLLRDVSHCIFNLIIFGSLRM